MPRFFARLCPLPALFHKRRKHMPLFASEPICAISKKIINPGDSIVRFTFWPSWDPADPLDVCYDAMALRSEFDKWAYKEEATKKLAEAWKNKFRNTKGAIILSNDEYYIVTTNRLDAFITIWFLKHIFYFTVSKTYWNQFCDKLIYALNEATIRLSENRELTIEKSAETVKVCFKTHPSSQGLQDCIETPFYEWSHLLFVISAHRELRS